MVTKFATGATEVVVIGGDASATTEVYSVDSDTWRPGPELSGDVELVVAVQDGMGSFYAVAGWLPGTEGLQEPTKLDSVYRGGGQGVACIVVL